MPRREEEEIAPDIMNDMQQLRDHFLDIFIRSFVNPLISAAAPPLNSNILTVATSLAHLAKASCLQLVIVSLTSTITPLRR